MKTLVRIKRDIQKKEINKTMKEEIKNLWLEALRSKDYKQSKNRLNDGLGLCCLGVLCEVAIENGLKVEKLIPDRFSEAVHYDGEGYDLPISVQKWAGMSSIEGELPGRASTRNLIELNDERNKSFKQIAVTINHFWEEL